MSFKRSARTRLLVHEAVGFVFPITRDVGDYGDLGDT
jgi:hypothetical protein